MSKRSPVLGYNHNFKHRGLIFHVQTEDSGVDNPHLFTHLFHGGVIISSRKVDYDAASEEDIVKGLMQSQHKAVLKDLKIGTFDDKIDSYLGDKEDLLPRKTGPVATPEPPKSESEATEPTVAVVQATEPDAPVVQATEPNAPLVEPPQARPPAITPMPDAAHSGAISLNSPSVSIPNTGPSVPVDNSATIRVPRMIEPDMELEAPLGKATKHRHERDPIPTPISVPMVSEDSLGDPVVTFNEAAPRAEIPADSVGERSATYSIQRPQQRRRAATQARTASPPSQPRIPPPPERSMGSRASGKSANPQPGMRRSSVVVSRPAVIIGAPARAVGGDASRRSKRRTPPARKTRNKDLFGNDTISEKSLDEVIMAYLSEDNSDD